MTRAFEWDGIGPKCDCQMLVQYDSSSDPTWEHFYWVPDEDFSGNGEYVYMARDFVLERLFAEEPCRFTSEDFTITHYAALPTIPRVIDLTERLRNDADEGAATV